MHFAKKRFSEFAFDPTGDPPHESSEDGKDMEHFEAEEMENFNTLSVRETHTAEIGESTMSDLVQEKKWRIVPCPDDRSVFTFEEGDNLKKELALINACRQYESQKGMLKDLLEAGVDLDSVLVTSCLHHAIRYQNMENIRILLQYGVNYNDTTFLVAAEFGNIQIINLLIERGSNIEAIDDEGNNALLRAMQNWDVESDIVRILAFNKDHLNRQNNQGFTALMIAADNEYFDVLKTLLELGADIHTVMAKDNESTALSIILDKSDALIFRQSLDCIEALVKYGALSSLPKHCLSVFHKMIVLDRRRLVQLFVTHGMPPCNVDLQQCEDGSQMPMISISPLCVALACNNTDIAKYLAGNWFLTPSDLSGLSSQCSTFVHSITMQESLQCLKELSSQPMSLMKISFVAVSAAIGALTGREARIMTLPIPSIIKDKLLFRKEDVTMDSGADE